MASPCRMSFLPSLLTIAVCASLLRVPEVEAARVPEADETPCVRDVDCLFKHLRPCSGLFVCNHGKCDCLPESAGRPVSPALPPSQCPGLKICNSAGKCFCTGVRPNSPAQPGRAL